MVADEFSYLAFIGQTQNPRTREIRERYLREFVQWLTDERLDVVTATTGDIVRFLDKNREFRARSTCGTILKTIRSYYRWLEARGVVSRSPAGQIKVETPPPANPKYVPVDDIRRMLSAARSDRNWALVALLAFNGMRVSELLACDVSDLESRSGRHLLHFRPRGENLKRPSVTVLVDEVRDRLVSQLDGRNHGPLFVTRRGERMGRQSGASGIVDWTARHAGLAYTVSPQMLTYSLPAAAMQHGFSYLSLTRAIGLPDRRYAERWIRTADAIGDDHAAVRMARLVLNEPGHSETWLSHSEAMLNETDLPESFAVASMGAVFERHLRLLCEENALPIRPEPKEGSIAAYISELHRAKLITLNERHMAERVAEWRNNAAHGAFHLLHAGSGAEALRSVRDFIARHPVASIEDAQSPS